MLDVILGEDIYNVAVVVTRYFGGVLLGTGGLVRAYSGAVQAGLGESTVIEKHHGISLALTADYTAIGKLQYIAAENQLPVLDTEYSSEYAADGLCVLTNLARNTLTEKSDQVITTGLGGVFPADLLVGVVQELVPEVSGKSTIAVIKPGTDPRTVRHAFIITSF